MWIPSQITPHFSFTSLPLINNFIHLASANTPFNKSTLPKTSVILPKQKKIQKSSLKLPVFQCIDCLQGQLPIDLIGQCRFRTLSVDQRREVTQINEEMIVQMVIRLSGEINLPSLKISVDVKKLGTGNQFYDQFRFRDFEKRQEPGHKVRVETQFLQNIELVCFGKPCLLLSSSLLENIDTFFEHLETISSGNIFEGPKRVPQQQHGFSVTKQDNPLWFSSLSFNKLSEWLCSSLQKKMLNTFQRRHKHSFSELKSPFTDTLTSAPEFIKFCLANQHLDPKFSQEYLNSLQKWVLLRIGDKSFQQIRSFQQSSQTLFELFNEEKTQQLFESLDEPKETKRKGKRSPRGKKQSKGVELDATSVSNKETENDTVNNSEEFEMDEEQGEKPQFQTEILIQQQAETVAGKDPITLSHPVEQRQASEFLIPQIPQEEQLNVEQSLKEEMAETSNQVSEQTKEATSHSHSQEDSIQIVKKRKHHKKKKKLSDKIAESLFESWVDQNVESFVDALSIESNKQMEARIIAFERVRHFASIVFSSPSLEAILYGSNAVGLSLPSSDIDILLKGLEIPNQLAMTQFLQTLSSQFKKMQWVVECSIFPQAKVPIIKLLVNLNYRFTDSYSYSFQHLKALEAFNGCFQLSAPIDSFISVDITLDMNNLENNHMGCDSTAFMKDRLSEYDQLYRTVLIIKYLLNKKSLNKTYKGGLSSYGVLLLCVSYLKQHPSEFPGSSLMNILQFYSSTFNNQHQMILYDPDNPCFKQIPRQSQNQCPNPLTLIDPLNNRVMTTNCSCYNSIKQQFKRILHSFSRVKEEMKEQLRGLESGQLKPYEEKKKCCEKFVKKYLQNYRLKDVIDQEASCY